MGFNARHPSHDRTESAQQLHSLNSQRTGTAQALHKLNSNRSTAAQKMHSNDAIKLVPSEPPGRSSRKARRFAPEMRALRAQGYTFEAIRLALASAGVHVSNATVQREVARASKASSVGQGFGSGAQADEVPSALSQAQVPATHPSTHAPPSAQVASVQTDLRSGKAIAEAFASGRITNPLARARLNAKDPP